MAKEGILKRFKESFLSNPYQPIAIGSIVLTAAIGIGQISSKMLAERENLEQLKNIYEFGRQEITATVLDESYSDKLSSVPERRINGLVSKAFSNETLRVNSTYVLKLKTDDGREISCSFFDAPTRDKEQLDMLVRKGSKISFPRGNVIKTSEGNYKRIPKETFFNEGDMFCKKRADRVDIPKDY
tara:strand:- start:4907 stop:5461 length:555 start_codon:yes stop_codon:yes gene_type:complete